MNRIQVIAFDADDTLWDNETYFQQAEAEYCRLLAHALPADGVSRELLATETRNVPLYGYGAKSFTLSMIEAALRITRGQADGHTVARILALGKTLLDMPVQPLPGVERTLRQLHGRYTLAVATKGDLLDQQRKLARSGLAAHFDHVEIMSDKRTDDYRRLMHTLRCPPEAFLMVGNSLRSDVEPVLAAGAWAAHVPFRLTWAHEQTHGGITGHRLLRLESIDRLPGLLATAATG